MAQCIWPSAGLVLLDLPLGSLLYSVANNKKITCTHFRLTVLNCDLYNLQIAVTLVIHFLRLFIFRSLTPGLDTKRFFLSNRRTGYFGTKVALNIIKTMKVQPNV